MDLYARRRFANAVALAAASLAALSGLLSEKLQGRGGQIEWGELALVEDSEDRQIGMSFYARWAA